MRCQGTLRCVAWDIDDVARSIRRYLAGTLEAPPWTIRTERREVRDDARPVAVIVPGPMLTQRARETRYQGEWTWVAPMTVSCYPAIDKDERKVANDARKLQAQLQRLIVNGIPVLDTAGALRSGPFRIPLYDYSATDLSGPDKAGPEDPHDTIWVERESLNVQGIQDPDDPSRWTVVLEFRASVEAPGALPEAEVDPDPEDLIHGVGPGLYYRTGGACP